MSTLLKQMIGASQLDANTYEEVEADRTTNGAAILVVIVSSIAAAVGVGARDFATIAGVTAVALVTWGVWVGLTYFIGTRLLPERQTHSDLGEILRTTGFSASPGVLRIFALIPGVGLWIFWAVTLWMLLSFVVAIRQALDYASSVRALAVCTLGWLIHGLVLFGFVMIAI
jgi:hypothetical protein